MVKKQLSIIASCDTCCGEMNSVERERTEGQIEARPER